MAELRPPKEVPNLRDRALRGFLLLAAQRAVNLAVTAVGGILLARLLMPEVFGVYGIIVFAAGLGVALGDLGLGAALVQRRDLEGPDLLGVAFTAQVALGLVLGAAILGIAPVLVSWLGLTPAAAAPLRALALSLPLSALRMPATVLLERNLAYLPLSLADTADTAVFYGVATVAAVAGAGVWSFVLGSLAARLVGLAVLLGATRWRPAPRWRWGELAPALKFGILFQGAALINLLRDAVVPTFVAAKSGVAAVGFLNWAASLAFLPLQVVGIAGRVLFPALSRLQGEPRAFAAATERALNRVAAILYPATILLLAGADPIVRLIYGDRWVPAVASLQLLCVAALLGGTSTVLVHGLYSLGRADLVLRLNLLWTALLWGLALLLVRVLGFTGFAAASAAVGATAPLTAWELQRLVPVRVLDPLRVPLAAAAASGLILAALARLWVRDIPTLVAAVAAAAGTYVAFAVLLGGAAWRAELLADWRRAWAFRT